MIPKSGNRFRACAKPWPPNFVWLDASAGEARSDKIMLKQRNVQGRYKASRSPGGLARFGAGAGRLGRSDHLDERAQHLGHALAGRGGNNEWRLLGGPL